MLPMPPLDISRQWFPAAHDFLKSPAALLPTNDSNMAIGMPHWHGLFSRPFAMFPAIPFGTALKSMDLELVTGNYVPSLTRRGGGIRHAFVDV